MIDNGMGMSEEIVENLLLDNGKVPKHGSGVGLINVHTRIQLMYGKEYGLKIYSEPDEGTEVVIHIPAIPFSEENRKNWRNRLTGKEKHMTKRNKITFLIAEALLAVLAAYFFYSIFHGDVPPKKVAVIVENSGDKRWDSLLNGMKQAAKVQNLSLIICNTDEQESSEDEQEMIREQLENDVDAFIINPAPGQDTKQVLEQLQGTKPFVLITQDIYSYEADAASSFVTVKPDNYKMGQELAEQMLKNTSGLMNGKRIGVVAGNARTEESRNRVRGFCEVMEAGGGRIIWKYNQESKEDAGEILKAKEKVDYLAVLDPYILDEVGEKAENGFYSGAEIYGIGTSIKAFSLLDAGKIQCLIVPDLYEVGYESMNEIASKLKNSWYQMESHETEIQVVYKKDLFSEDIERFLYSYE